MSRVWFSQPLETVATFWRVSRRDGVMIGLTTHDRDLWFDDILHRAAPGMIPSAIRRSADLAPDSAEVQGALSHDAIAEDDLVHGRFDGARVLIGVVDWENGENAVLYRGTIGGVEAEAGTFSAALLSRKAELQHDPVPRTSPTCRATFCGPGCTLSAARFTRLARCAGYDADQNAVAIAGALPLASYAGGWLRWLDGPLAGLTAGIADVAPQGLVLDQSFDIAPVAGTLLSLREGCDRTIATCAGRFGNAINFQGEPYLPGNDLVTRYPGPAA